MSTTSEDNSGSSRGGSPERPSPLGFRRGVCLLTLVLAALAGGAPVAAGAKLTIANPGRFSAGVTRCTPVSYYHCGGALEINGQFYNFEGGRVTGAVGSSGAVANVHASFGTASTDPAVQGPLQLSFTPVALSPGGGAFYSARSPLGLAAPGGLNFYFRVALYIRVTGEEPPAAAGPSPGANLGGGCTIGSTSAPLEAEFLPTLAGFFGSGGGVAYDQTKGSAELTATRLKLPGAQDCQGLEGALDQQLGIPGPGSLSMSLTFSPPIVTSGYRAAHRGRHQR